MTNMRRCCLRPHAVVATRDAMHKKMLSVIEQLLARGATKHLLVVSELGKKLNTNA